MCSPFFHLVMELLLKDQFSFSLSNQEGERKVMMVFAMGRYYLSIWHLQVKPGFGELFPLHFLQWLR